MKKRRTGKIWLLVLFSLLCLFRPADIRAEESYNYANLIVFAYFHGEGEEDGRAFWENTANRDKYEELYTGEKEIYFCNYLKKISDGRLNVSCLFPQDDGTRIIPYEIQCTTLAEAQQKDKDAEIIREIIRNCPDITRAELDYNGDGYIDNLTVILYGAMGRDGSDGGSTSSMYAHKADYSGEDTWCGKKVGNYNMLNSDTVTEGLTHSSSGVLVHEFMHSLGFPDLYNRDTASAPPVDIWDIMAAVSRAPQWPLAYMRMACGGWIPEADIPVITESRTQVTLDTQEHAAGTRAVILKSPLNPTEFFVVEYRRKGTDKEHLEYYIGDSGLIVYRIDPRVDHLSNYGGETGVYIFRPQEGQNGYVSPAESPDPMRATIINAALSSNSGRTSMGREDLSLTLSAGALTFTDGKNSGIVISHVSAAGGDQMTFDVSIPDASALDLWTDLTFPDTADSSNDIFNKQIALAEWNHELYAVTYNYQGQQQIALWKQEDGGWSRVGGDIRCSGYGIAGLQLKTVGNELYLAYSDYGDGALKVCRYTGASWSQEASLSSCNYFHLASRGDQLLIAYVQSEGWNGWARLASLRRGVLTSLADYAYGAFGQVRTAADEAHTYMAVKDSRQNICIYERLADGTVKRIDSADLQANSFDMAVLDGKLYVTGGDFSGAPMVLHVYDGASWETIESSYTMADPSLVVSQGKLYVLITPDRDGFIQVLRYEAETGTFAEEGINIDSQPTVLDFTSIDNRLYAAYVKASGNQMIVKMKETVNGWSAPVCYGASLSLSGNIGMNFYMDLPAELAAQKDAYMCFTLQDQSVQKVSVAEAEMKQIGAETYYVFTCYMNSWQMDMAAAAQMFDEHDQPAGASYACSIAGYADAVKADPQGLYAEKVKALAAAMRNYGTYAQAFFAGKTAEASAAMKEVTAADLAAYADVRRGTMPAGLSLGDSLLVLDTGTSIRCYFSLEEGASLQDYTFKVNGAACGIKQESKGYYIEIPNIGAHKLSASYIVTVNDAYSYRVSALGAAYRVLAADGQPENLKSLMQALYLYSWAADEYLK